MNELTQPRADFFVTGDEYMRDSLDLQFIPRATLGNNTIGGGNPCRG